MTTPPTASSRLLRRLAPLAALVALVPLSGLATPASAQLQGQPLDQPRTALGLRAGTAGVGVDLVGRVSDRAHVRLGAGTVGFDGTISTDTLDYDAEADLSTALLLLDWYPGGGAFRLSAGAGWNGTEVEVTAPLAQLVPPELVDDLASIPGLLPPLGSAVGTAQGEELVPVVLLGWGNPFRGGRWNLSFEIGAFYQGAPEVDLVVRPGFDLDEALPGLGDALRVAAEEEERELERELEDYTVVPVVSLSLTYSF